MRLNKADALIDLFLAEWMITAAIYAERMLKSEERTAESAQNVPNDELISKKSAIDCVKASPINGWVKEDLIQALETAPSAQPEIIRCKGCKHQVKEWRTDKRLKDNGYMVCGCDVVGDACGYWALLGQDDDYCSMAERKPDG